MQDYAPKCKKVPLDHLIVTPLGLATPQCQTCSHKNCGHPIEKFKVSVMGLQKEWRLFNSHGKPMAVFECEQYTPEESTIKTRSDSLQ